MNYDDMDELEPDITCYHYGSVELPEVAVAKFCLEMWRWWPTPHYVSLTGRFEWYFW